MMIRYMAAMVLSAIPIMALALDVTSQSLREGKPMATTQVYNGFGCTGKNISPDLQWSDAPAGTKAFAVTAYDPDAPTGSGWWHWMLVNLPANTSQLEAGAGNDAAKLPKGAMNLTNDYGKKGYGGACPPAGERPHRYQFTVFALKQFVPAEAMQSAAMVGFYLNQLALAKQTITVTYGR